ncbi:MAG: hypothetical protein ACLUNQ_05095 [Oscillospiraceae bacterium]
MAEDCFHPLGDGKLLDPVPLVGTLVILLAVGSNMKNLMGLGEETIRELNVVLQGSAAHALRRHRRRRGCGVRQCTPGSYGVFL